MVRLKEFGIIDKFGDMSISIPYGAIKSGARCDILYINEISIPYGAIKRNLLRTIIDGTFAFQFLMVRLKDNKTHIPRFACTHFNSLWCD